VRLNGGLVVVTEEMQGFDRTTELAALAAHVHVFGGACNAQVCIEYL